MARWRSGGFSLPELLVALTLGLVLLAAFWVVTPSLVIYLVWRWDTTAGLVLHILTVYGFGYKLVI